MSSARITNSLFDGNKVILLTMEVLLQEVQYMLGHRRFNGFNEVGDVIEIINNTIINNEATNNNGFVSSAGFLRSG